MWREIFGKSAFSSRNKGRKWQRTETETEAENVVKNRASKRERETDSVEISVYVLLNLIRMVGGFDF